MEWISVARWVKKDSMNLRFECKQDDSSAIWRAIRSEAG